MKKKSNELLNLIEASIKYLVEMQSLLSEIPDKVWEGLDQLDEKEK